MVLRDLTLVNFRNFSQKEFQFAPGVTLVYGENAAGKSNLLEAIYLLASGGSLRADKTGELIREGELFAKVSARGNLKSREAVRLEILLEEGTNLESGHGHKIFRVNGVPRQRRDFIGNLKTVMFSPEQLNLINDGPSYRRNYLDLTLSQIDRNYFVAISAYKKALFNRNRLLYQIGTRSSNVQELSYWDGILVENSLVVCQQRSDYINFINNNLIERGLQLQYLSSPLSLERLTAYRDKELAAGRTLVGPQREDVVFMKARRGAEGTNLHRYGSRGEQRLAVFALKLAEWEFLARDGDKPILLLDDIFSELDDNHRRIIFSTLAAEQTLITTAEESVISGLMPKNWPVLRLP